MIKRILKWALGSILLLSILAFGYYRLFLYVAPLISDSDRQEINMMPLPGKVSLKGSELCLGHDFQVDFDEASEILTKSIQRFRNNLSLKVSGFDKVDCATKLTISINDSPSAIPNIEMDESYELKVSTKGITLNAESQWGVNHGLESILQLIKFNDHGAPYINTLLINDAPRFPWRGIMIDVSRHWIPKEVILRNLDAMAVVKMNVLHLHLSDDQGFRVESKVYPKLHEIGSNGKYFTQADIKEIIQHATERGIRIVPEFDMPGHTQSWLMAYPEFSSVDQELSFEFSEGQLFSVPIDVTNEGLYVFLDRFIGEMVALFPDEYFHIGGDEINPKYWEESDRIQKYIKDNGMNDSHDLQAYFNQRIHTILAEHEKIMMGWEEVAHPELDSTVVVQAWKSHKSLFKAVQSGHKGILSNNLYLDHKLHSDAHYRVDPFFMPGAVDIVPDTAYWKRFSLTTELPGGEMEMELVIFDRDPSSVFGFFEMMDNRTAFQEGTLDDGRLSVPFDVGFGDMSFKADIMGDALDGAIHFGLMKMKSEGILNGGSQMPESTLPKIETIKPLTDEEKSRILGGEAAMWSEVVGTENIDSRIWPRTASIAEKLWSPAELTNDIEDMYRRLTFINEYLSERGVTHITAYEPMLDNLTGGERSVPLKVFVDALEEVKYYDRLAMYMDGTMIYWPDLPMDNVVDVAKPESLTARRFNKKVEKYIESPNEELINELADQLKIWANNHEKLSPLIRRSPKLKGMEVMSEEFSDVARIALNQISTGFEEGSKHNEKEIELLRAKLSYLETGEEGVLVAVVPGLRNLIIH